MNSVAVLQALLDLLWTRYQRRVSYAAKYAQMVEALGGVVQNDHIALRTFNAHTGSQPAGVDALARVFTALGYEQKDRYLFTDKKLTAWHYEHQTLPAAPKIFISQLEVDQLPSATAAAINQAVVDAPDLLSAENLAQLEALRSGKILSAEDGAALAENCAKLFQRPWQAPLRSVISDVNVVSQYAAWTLLHGNSVNHFTAYINEQKVSAWPDLVITAAALGAAGVPMKTELEGEAGSKLRQTSTQAVMEDCAVRETDGSSGTIRWSYAYYELAERGMVPGADGKPMRFQAFLGEQATNLFEMTKTS